MFLLWFFCYEFVNLFEEINIQALCCKKIKRSIDFCQLGDFPFKKYIACCMDKHRFILII